MSDPTDAHAPAIPQPGKLELLDALPTLQALHGICSEPGCQWPIAGWCADGPSAGGCRAKLCYDHLQEHRNRHARVLAAPRFRISADNLADAIDLEAGAVDWTDDEQDDDETEELAAHLRDEGMLICSCGEPLDDECPFCGASLCAGGLLMHATLGCEIAQRLEPARPDAPGRE